MFHSTGAAMVKPHLPITFLEWNEVTDSLFPRVRMSDFIKYDREAGKTDGLDSKEAIFKDNMI